MAYNLTTLAAAKEWLNCTDTTEDSKITANIARASAMVRRWLGYDPISQTYTNQKYNGQGTLLLATTAFPITAVSSLTIDGTSISAQTSAPLGAGYFFEDRFIHLIGYGFTKGVQNVVVSYTAGHTFLPEEISIGCLMTVQALHTAGAIDPNIAGENAGGFSASYKPNIGVIPVGALEIMGPFKRSDWF